MGLSVQRAPLSTDGEQVGQNHPKCEGGKVVSVVVMPPQAHQELITILVIIFLYDFFSAHAE